MQGAELGLLWVTQGSGEVDPSVPHTAFVLGLPPFTAITTICRGHHGGGDEEVSIPTATAKTQSGVWSMRNLEAYMPSTRQHCLTPAHLAEPVEVQEVEGDRHEPAAGRDAAARAGCYSRQRGRPAQAQRTKEHADVEGDRRERLAVGYCESKQKGRVAQAAHLIGS